MSSARNRLMWPNEHRETAWAGGAVSRQLVCCAKHPESRRRGRIWMVQGVAIARAYNRARHLLRHCNGALAPSFGADELGDG
jgi:hypothetical protein